MSQPTGSLYEVRWSEIFPWLILVRALRVSLLIRVLLLAAVGVLVTEWGWSFLARAFDQPVVPLNSLEVVVEDRLQSSATDQDSGVWLADWFWTEFRRHPLGPMVTAWQWLSAPFVGIFQMETTWRQAVALLLFGAWAVAVWALFGGVIARIAALHLTREQTLSPQEAFTGSLASWPAIAGGPLVVLLLAALFALPLALLGLLIRLDMLALVVGLLWVVVLLGGIALAFILLAFWFGWPLMWATIGVERTDAFDAASRTGAYVYQKPLHLLFGILVASLLGVVGQLIVSGFASASIALADWAVSWGAGIERTLLLATPAAADAGPELLTGVGATAAGLIQTWNGLLRLLAVSYSVGFLFSASTGIYLLMRLYVDSTEMNEVADEAGKEISPMPPLKDEDGVPQVDRGGTSRHHDGSAPA